MMRLCRVVMSRTPMMSLPNGSRLSCGRLARRRKSSGRQSVPRQGHNTPLPLKRPPPASFKRLLGSGAISMCAPEPADGWYDEDR